MRMHLKIVKYLQQLQRKEMITVVKEKNANVTHTKKIAGDESEKLSLYSIRARLEQLKMLF